MSKIAVRYLNTQNTYQFNGEKKGEAGILRIKTVPSLAMILSGTMDWLTTIVGIGFFGAIESNPFMAGLTSTSLITFTIVKLSTTLLVAFMFHKADQTLLETMDKKSRSFSLTRLTLKGAYFISTALLAAAVLNNIIVVVRAL